MDGQRNGGRRRTRAPRRAALTCLAAIAVAVAPGGCAAVDGPGAAPATSSSTASPSTAYPAAPAAPGSSAPGGLADLPRGADPGVGVLLGRTLTEPDGRTTDVPVATVAGLGLGPVVRAGDGLLVGDGITVEGTGGLVLVEDGGSTPIGPCTSGSAAALPGGRAAWTTFACPESGETAPTRLVVRGADGRPTSTDLALPPGGTLVSSVVGALGQRLVVNRGLLDGSYLVEPGRVPTPVPGVRSLTEVSTGGRSGIGRVRGGGPTAVVALPSGRVRWRGPTLLGFSPDGSRVVSGRDRLTVKATGSGRVLADLAPPPGVLLVSPPVWEDATHLLVVAQDVVGRSVVRLGTDGSIERAGGPLPPGREARLVR